MMLCAIALSGRLAMYISIFFVNKCRKPRGFGFVKFRCPEDAAEAKAHLNRSVIGGREIKIVFAEENRKTPREMRRISCSRFVVDSVSTFLFVLVTCLNRCCSIFLVLSFVSFYLSRDFV